MNSKIIAAAGVGAAIIVVVALLATTDTTPNNENPVQINKKEKLGLVINSPQPQITLQEFDEIYTQAASTGIGRSNVYMFWNLLEPERGQYDWKQYDAIMGLNQKNDLKVTLYFSIINGKTLGPFPDWIGNPSLKSINDELLVDVLDAVLTRYNIIDSVIISGETDAQFRYNENNIPIYADFFNIVYEKIKEKHSNIKMGNAFSLHGVLNKNLEHIVKDLSLGDFVAFSYFPVDSLNEIIKNPIEATADLSQVFILVPQKDVAFFEVSWSTTDFVGGSTEDQSKFLGLIFDFYEENESKIQFFTWYRQYDKLPGSCYIDPESVEGEISIGGGSGLGSSEFVIERLSEYICNAGLLDVDGNPKAGWNIFKEQIQSIT